LKITGRKLVAALYMTSPELEFQLFLPLSGALIHQHWINQT